MRAISTVEITDKIRELCIRAAVALESDAATAIRGAFQREQSPLGKEILGEIIKNFEAADAEKIPMCQDTGVAVFFVEVGREVMLDGSLEDAVNQGVSLGYRDGYLRKSLCDPLTRKNTGDNTPAIVHTRLVEGDRIRIRFAPKGAGSENMSSLKMLMPSDGLKGIKDFVVDTVTVAGANPCPPIIVGVGIGGDFEKSALLAKEALLRQVGSPNPVKELDPIEKELLEKINSLGIGPMGFGGTVTALAVHIKTFPCHIASLPVAVNIQCHADRHKEAEI